LSVLRDILVSTVSSNRPFFFGSKMSFIRAGEKFQDGLVEI